jgi:hypothetical protein
VIFDNLILTNPNLILTSPKGITQREKKTLGLNYNFENITESDHEHQFVCVRIGLNWDSIQIFLLARNEQLGIKNIPNDSESGR